MTRPNSVSLKSGGRVANLVPGVLVRASTLLFTLPPTTCISREYRVQRLILCQWDGHLDRLLPFWLRARLPLISKICAFWGRVLLTLLIRLSGACLACGSSSSACPAVTAPHNRQRGGRAVTNCPKQTTKHQSMEQRIGSVAIPVPRRWDCFCVLSPAPWTKKHRKSDIHRLAVFKRTDLRTYEA